MLNLYDTELTGIESEYEESNAEAFRMRVLGDLLKEIHDNSPYIFSSNGRYVSHKAYV